MPDVAASVLARLKNKANESGRTYQLCLQLFCQEEFLRRLEESKYAENLVLKGGLFIYTITDFDSRVTMDIDFLLRKVPNTPEQLKTVLEEIISAPTGNDFVTYEIKSVAPIAVAKKYAGIGASLVARIKNTKTPLNIDFGVGDVIVPKHEKRKIPTQLEDFSAPAVNTYSLETTIAEKIDAILNLMEFSSRMKDYYDIYYLANKFDFDGVLLTEAMKKTFANRDHSFTVKQFEQVMAFNSDEAMQKKWKAFCRKTDIKTDDYSTVLKTINEFLFEPFVAAVEGRNYAFNNTKEDIVVSSVNEVFSTQEDKLYPEYLCMFFNRTEFDRYARFHSWGSARETFTWNDLIEVKIPIPDIAIQKSIAEMYTVYNKRKKINEQLKAQIKNICPILIRGSLEDGGEPNGEPA